LSIDRAGSKRNIIARIQIRPAASSAAGQVFCGRTVDFMALRVASPTPHPPYCKQAAASGGDHPTLLILKGAP
jgi:hypothetical protein